MIHTLHSSKEEQHHAKKYNPHKTPDTELHTIGYLPLSIKHLPI